MALFTARPETRPHESARLAAPGAALERANRTVQRLTFSVHGATDSDASGHPLLHRAPRRPVTGVQPVPGSAAPRAATQGLRNRRQDTVRSAFCSSKDDGAGGKMPVQSSSSERGPASFTVQRVNPWPNDRARLMAKEAAIEQENRTVRRLTFPLHGATDNDASGHPFLHRAPRRPVTGVQPVPGLAALRAATRAMRSSRPGAEHGPTDAALPLRGGGCVTPPHWGVTQSAAQVTTRPSTAFRR